MNKILKLSILAVLAICIPMAVSAQSTGTGFYTQLGFTQPTKGDALLDLGHLGLWNVECTGIASVSSSDKSATLTGNYSGKVWQFMKTTDSVVSASTVWEPLGTLVESITVPANTYSAGQTERLVLSNINARWLYIGYDATLSSSGYFANASGNGTMRATAVPEPSSMLCIGSLFSGAGLLFRKRKS